MALQERNPNRTLSEAYPEVIETRKQEKITLLEAFTQGRALAQEYFNRIGATHALNEMAGRVLNPKIVPIHNNFEAFYQSRLKTRQGTGEFSSRAAFRNYHTFSTNLDFNEKEGTHPKRLKVTARFRAKYSQIGRESSALPIFQDEGLDPSNCMIQVALINNPDISGTNPGSQPKGILLPDVSQIDGTCIQSFDEIFNHALEHPITLTPKEKYRSYKPIPFNSFPVTNVIELIATKKRKKQELDQLLSEFLDLPISNPFAKQDQKLGEISYRLGRLTLNRFGIKEILDRLQQEGKSLVFSSAKFGDIYAFSIRWDIGEFKDYACKEVTIAIKPTEDDLVALRNDTYGKNSSARVFVIAGAQDAMDLQLPISPSFTKLTPDQQHTFLTNHKSGQVALNAAIKKALADPRKALRMSPNSIASSLAYAIPVISGAKNKTYESSDDNEKTAWFGLDGEIVDDDDHIILAKQIILDEEEEEALLEEADDNRISYGDAHGEVSWFDGHGTDEDGCEVYPSD